MKKLVILGSGTGGTIIAAKMRQKLLESKWEITIIDRDWQHHYQPGWLFIPFGIYTAEDCVKPKIKYIPPGVNFVLDEVTGIDPEKEAGQDQAGHLCLRLAGGGHRLRHQAGRSGGHERGDGERHPQFLFPGWGGGPV